MNVVNLYLKGVMGIEARKGLLYLGEKSRLTQKVSIRLRTL